MENQIEIQKLVRHLADKRQASLEKACLPVKHGFTLIELILVIAIIGILASVVMVSSQSAVDKSKRASALTSASSILPELVTCQDDGGRISSCTLANCSTAPICIKTTDTTALSGHTATWPNITKTGWVFNKTTITTNANIGTMSFTLTKGSGIITCTYATNECTDNGL
jgi:prepilin-type N-terminal cleavage/methylation domain-containing protein